MELSGGMELFFFLFGWILFRYRVGEKVCCGAIGGLEKETSAVELRGIALKELSAGSFAHEFVGMVYLDNWGWE